MIQFMDAFTHINSDLFDTNTRAVVDDLIQGYEGMVVY
jgi:hypothetical protein